MDKKTSQLNIEYNVPLAPLTTMGVGGSARYFVRVKREEDIQKVFNEKRFTNIPTLILGEGSNIIVSDDGFPGLVLKMEIQGICILEESDSNVKLVAGAGEPWDSFVEYTVQNRWWGIENMSLIPGTVGAIPVQNVSAYGQEAKTVISKVRAYDTQQERFVELKNDECKFSFRKSIFNTTAAGRYIIVAVDFILSKIKKPNLTRSEVIYAIERQRHQKAFSVSLIYHFISRLIPGKMEVDYSQSEIREAIIVLRSSGKKLPPPNSAGNSGTFFCASVVPHDQLNPVLKKACKNVGLSLALKILWCRWKYSSNDGFKLSSRLLIKACGLEKLHRGSISLLPTNCAVLINYGDKASAKDILKLIHRIRTDVYLHTGVVVPVEPALVGFDPDELDETFALPANEKNA